MKMFTELTEAEQTLLDQYVAIKEQQRLNVLITDQMRGWDVIDPSFEADCNIVPVIPSDLG